MTSKKPGKGTAGETLSGADWVTRKRNAKRYAYAGDDPISGHDPSGRVLGLTCGTAVVAGLAAITFTELNVAEIVAAAAATAPTVGTSAMAGAGAAVG